MTTPKVLFRPLLEITGTAWRRLIESGLKALLICKRQPFLCLFFLSLLVIRFLLSTSGHVVTSADTGWYCDRARAPFWSFLSGYDQGKPFMRPLGYPLVLRLCGFRPDHLPADGGALRRFQVLLSVLALAAAGLVGCRIYDGLAPRLIWIMVFFAFSLSAFIYPWEPIAMTEGVACNGVTLVLAMTFVLACPEWGMGAALMTAFLAGWMIFLKDANSFNGLILLGLLFFEGLFLRRRPRAALAQLREAFLHPARLFRLPLFVLTCLLLLLTLLKLRDLGQHAFVREANLTSFLLDRVHKVPALHDAFIQTFNPPAAVRTPTTPDNAQAYWDYAKTYKHHHLRFLLTHPGVAFKTFNLFSGDIIAYAALNSNDRPPKAYVYLFEWANNPWNRSQPYTKMAFSYLVHRCVVLPFSWLVISFGSWPFFLPLGLLVATLMLRLKIGRAGLFLPLAFLASTFYLQHGLSILFEGIEDYRHGLMGTYALVLMPWLVALAAAQSLAARLFNWITRAAEAGAPGGNTNKRNKIRPASRSHSKRHHP